MMIKTINKMSGDCGDKWGPWGIGWWSRTK